MNMELNIILWIRVEHPPLGIVFDKITHITLHSIYIRKSGLMKRILGRSGYLFWPLLLSVVDPVGWIMYIYLYNLCYKRRTNELIGKSSPNIYHESFTKRVIITNKFDQWTIQHKKMRVPTEATSVASEYHSQIIYVQKNMLHWNELLSRTCWRHQ